MKTICIMCPMGCPLDITEKNGEVTVCGNTCKRGELYGRDEYVCPKRVVTSLVRLRTGGVVSVKTNKQIDKHLIGEVLGELKRVTLTPPLSIGDVVVKNVAESGADIVVTSEIK